VIQKFDFIAMLESITRHKIRHLMQVIILSTRLHLLKTSLQVGTSDRNCIVQGNMMHLALFPVIECFQHPAAAKYDFSHIKFAGVSKLPSVMTESC
jgi:hypothetical protein